MSEVNLQLMIRELKQTILTIPSVGEDVEQREWPSLLAGTKVTPPLGRTVGQFLKS